MSRLLLGCGSRAWPSPFRAAVEFAAYPGFELMHGAANGADSALDAAALASGLVPGVSLHRRPAAWDRHGQAAGPIRNREMAAECKAVLDAGGTVEGLALGALTRADEPRRSSGTGHMVALLRALGVRVRWVPAPDAEAQTLALRVWTARLAPSLRDPDLLNITRQTGGDAGAPFAPSWAILKPAIEARREGRDDEAWGTYVPLFWEEMRVSYRVHRTAWRSLLARDRIVFACVCPDRARCHRGLVAQIFAKLGAIDCGELPIADPRQLRMPGV